VSYIPIIDAGLKIIEKIIPDPEQKARAQLELLKLQQEGDFKELELSLSAIIADAKSADTYTSRARPTFLYVVYILILWSLPMGVMFVVNPEAAAKFAEGFGFWLRAIPPEIVDLFKIVMLGYIGGRTFEKVKGAAK
jgi:hypothetical protein